jgi:hypothetical protein
MASRKGEARAAVARRRASEMSVGLDLSEIAPTPLEIQTARLRARFDVSPAVAAVIAAHAFGVVDRWGRA